MDAYRSVVITGGNGMLATELGKALTARRVKYVAVDRDVCDITDVAQLSGFFEKHQPTLLLNCAAHTAVDLCEEQAELADLINGTGPANLATLSKKHHTKLVHFSTDFVFDGSNQHPYQVTAVPNPISAYGKSKLLGEKNIAQISPPAWIVVRTAWLFGRHGHCFPKVVLDRAKGGQPLKVVSDQRGCPTYAVDLSRAVLNLIDHQAAGFWHLTNDGPTNWYEFTKAIMAEFGVTADITAVSTDEWRKMRPKQAHRPAYSVLDLEPYHRLTGVKMRHWHDALRDYRTELENCS